MLKKCALKDVWLALRCLKQKCFNKEVMSALIGWMFGSINQFFAVIKQIFALVDELSYRPTAVKMISEMGFLQSLQTFDKDNIPPAIVQCHRTI